MESKFAIAGHPVHPMLVALPIGLFVWALATSIIYLISDSDRTWYEISYWSSIAGIATAFLAAVPGFVDGFTIARNSEAREKAMLHMSLNLVVIGLFFGAVLLMRDNGALDGGELTFAVALQAIAVGLLALSGWIGGEMVFRDHLATIPEDSEVAAEEQRRHSHKPQPRQTPQRR
jgi:uncharacterized membrane protein